MMETREFRYRLIDVFAERPFTGNPLAVFSDARGLGTDTMQVIARELNRPQTTFVFPAEDDSHNPRVRVFTPNAELPRPQYPTIGAAFALECDRGTRGSSTGQRVVFEAADGPISVSSFARVLTVRQPLPVFGDYYGDIDAALAILGLTDIDRLPGAPVQAVDGGVGYTLVPLRNLSAIRRIGWRQDIWERTVARTAAPKILAFTLETERATSMAKMRVFAPDVGVQEDPATETACGPLAAYLIRYGFLAPESPQVLVLEQGAEVRRPSFLHVAIERGNSLLTSVRVGGQCVAVGEGILSAEVSEES